MKRFAKWLLEPFAKVYRRFFDPRFADLKVAVEKVGDRTSSLMSGAVAGIEVSTRAQNEVLAVVGRDIRRFEIGIGELQRLADISDALAWERQALEAMRAESADALAWERQALEAMRAESAEIGRSLSELIRQAKPLSPLQAEDMDHQTAELLDYAHGHLGPAAQSGLWFNPPVSVRHRAGHVDIRTVNERIVEIPFVLRELARVPLGCPILDVGGRESYIAFQLASLGYLVTSIDLNEYPFIHPNLVSVCMPLEDWGGPSKPFDAIVCLSSIEHFGLGAYGEEPTPGRLDLVAMDRLRTWLAPGGPLILTVPFGEAEVTELHRIYDEKGLEELLDGWVVESTQFGTNDGLIWQVADHPDVGAMAKHFGVALIVARREP